MNIKICDYRQVKRWRLETNIFQQKKIIDKIQKEIVKICEINDREGCSQDNTVVPRLAIASFNDVFA